MISFSCGEILQFPLEVSCLSFVLFHLWFSIKSLPKRVCSTWSLPRSGLGESRSHWGSRPVRYVHHTHSAG